MAWPSPRCIARELATFAALYSAIGFAVAALYSAWALVRQPRCMARAFLSAAALDSAHDCLGGRDSSSANGVADAKVDNADDTGKCCYVNVFCKRKCFRMFSRNVAAHSTY